MTRLHDSHNTNEYRRFLRHTQISNFPYSNFLQLDPSRPPQFLPQPSLTRFTLTPSHTHPTHISRPARVTCHTNAHARPAHYTTALGYHHEKRPSKTSSRENKNPLLLPTPKQNRQLVLHRLGSKFPIPRYVHAYCTSRLSNSAKLDSENTETLSLPVVYVHVL